MRSTLDIDRSREQLNELPFEDGRREIFVGKISELFAEESDQAIADHLRQCEQELRRHTLILSRHEDDRDVLFIVQELRALPPDFSSMVKGMNWVSKITTIGLEMVLPGLVGLWLDSQLETGFLGLLGFALGGPLGIWHLIAMTKIKRSDIE